MQTRTQDFIFPVPRKSGLDVCAPHTKRVQDVISLSRPIYHMDNDDNYE